MQFRRRLEIGEWEGKAKTCQPHFGSNLIVVNNRLYVVGGNVYIDDHNVLQGYPSPVEAYDEEQNTWSVVHVRLTAETWQVELVSSRKKS